MTTALNRWVIAEANRNADLAGMATTLRPGPVRPALPPGATSATAVSTGCGTGNCWPLTIDHTWDHPELNNVLSRAIGLDPRC